MSPRVGSYGEMPTLTVARDDLDPEPSHPAAQLRQHLVTGVTLHPVQSSSQDTRWANGRSAARVQHAECDDRHGPPSVLRHRSMKHRWFVACEFRFVHQRPLIPIRTGASPQEVCSRRVA